MLINLWEKILWKQQEKRYQSIPPAQKSDISEATITTNLCVEGRRVPGVAKAIKVDNILGVVQELRVEDRFYGIICEKIIEDSFAIKIDKLPGVSIDNYRSIQPPYSVIAPGVGKTLEVGLLLDDNKGRKLTGYNPLYLTIIYNDTGLVNQLEVPGRPLIFQGQELREWPSCTRYQDKDYALPITSGTYMDLIEKISPIKGHKMSDSILADTYEYPFRTDILSYDFPPLDFCWG